MKSENQKSKPKTERCGEHVDREIAFPGKGDAGTETGAPGKAPPRRAHERRGHPSRGQGRTVAATKTKSNSTANSTVYDPEWLCQGRRVIFSSSRIIHGGERPLDRRA